MSMSQSERRFYSLTYTYPPHRRLCRDIFMHTDAGMKALLEVVTEVHLFWLTVERDVAVPCVYGRHS